MNPHLQPWTIAAEDFPADSYASDQLEFLIGYAILAPSSHNTQPWLFRINAMDVEIHADRRRVLAAIDPNLRELVTSCGAALFNLRTAAEYFGHRYEVELFPLPDQPDCIARFRLGLSGETSSDDIVTFHAMTQRHTHRGPFRPDPLPDDIAAELVAVAQQEGATLQLITGDEGRAVIADAVAEADRVQWADKGFREELARWVRPKPQLAVDGLPTSEAGVSDWLAFAGPALIRTFDRGGGQAARHREIAAHAPTLAILSTDTDDPLAWVRAGQALQSVLLHARTEDVWASFLNQATEVPEVRARMAASLGVAGFPQVVLRLGYGEAVTPTPRRSVREMLIMHRTGHA